MTTVSAFLQLLWNWLASAWKVDKLVFTMKSVLPCSREALFKWHAANGALERLNPPFARALVVGRSSPFSLRDGQVRLAVPILPFFSLSLNAFHVSELYREGNQFADSLVSDCITHRYPNCLLICGIYLALSYQTSHSLNGSMSTDSLL
jgi:hypothetical protein